MRVIIHIMFILREIQILVSFIVMCTIKLLSITFYRLRVTWANGELLKEQPWSDKTKAIIFLGHTSLYEPIFAGAIPFSFLWYFSRRMIAPVASKTTERPIVGLFWKLLAPQMTSISRKRDKTWDDFLKSIKDDKVIIIAPEGRMKRPNGLDLHGKEMSVRSGIGEIVSELESGEILFLYSTKGLHHVQAPGQFLPRIFKTVNFHIETIEISEYKNQVKDNDEVLRKAIVKDMNQRLKKYCL